MSVPSLILALSPVFYYRLGETGTDNPVDSSPTGNGGLLGGGYTWGQPGAITGDANTALELSGGDFYLSTRAALTGDHSHLAWIKTTNTDSSSAYAGDVAQTVFGDGSGAVWESFGVSGNFAQFKRYGSSSWNTWTGTTVVNDGEWHQIGMTYNSVTSIVKIYVDGILDFTDGAAAHQTYGGVNRIGKGYDQLDVFIGTLDEVASFASVLSATDFSDIYAAAQPTSVTAAVNSTVSISTTVTGSFHAPTYIEQVITDGAVGFWPLDDIAAPFVSAVGGPSLALATGTVTPQSRTLAAGLPSTVSLSGSISDTSLPAGAFNGSVDFTLEAWVSPSVAQSTVPILLGDGNNGVGLFVAASGGPPGLLLQGLLANVSLVPSAVTAVIDTAYYLVLQFKAGIGVQMYVDAVASGSVVGAGPIAPSTLTQSQFYGDIGYLAVYPTALTPTQITDHYTLGITSAESSIEIASSIDVQTTVAGYSQAVAVVSSSQEINTTVFSAPENNNIVSSTINISTDIIGSSSESSVQILREYFGFIPVRG